MKTITKIIKMKTLSADGDDYDSVLNSQIQLTVLNPSLHSIYLPAQLNS